MPEPTPPTDAELWDLGQTAYEPGSRLPYAYGARDYPDQIDMLRVVFEAGRASGTEPKPDPATRFSPEDKATLIKFAAGRIQSVWNDVGETDAMTLAQNVVAAQEFAWLSMHFPVQRPKPDPEVARLSRDELIRLAAAEVYANPTPNRDLSLATRIADAILAAASADQLATRADEPGRDDILISERQRWVAVLDTEYNGSSWWQWIQDGLGGPLHDILRALAEPPVPGEEVDQEIGR